MATDLKERAPGSDEDSRIPNQYGQHLAPKNMPGAPGVKPGSVAGGPQQQGGKDKAGNTATQGAFQAAKNASNKVNEAGQKVAEKGIQSAAPEAAAALEAFNKFKQALTGTKGRKQASAATIVATVLAGATLLGFLAVLPDELISFIENLEQHFFAKIEYDIDKESQKEIQSYLKRRVARRLLAGCKSSADECASDEKDRPDGDDETADADPLEGNGGLFDSLDQSDFAGQMADRGFTFTSEGGRIILNADGLPGGKLDITDALDDDGTDLFDMPELVESGVGEAMQSAINEIVAVNGSFEHEQVTKLVNEDDGDDFCLVDCEESDQAEANDQAKATAAVEDKAAEAVDYSDINATATVELDAISCMTDTTCDPTARTADNTDAATNEDAGDPKSGWDKQVEVDLDATPSANLNSMPADEKNVEALAEKGAEEGSEKASEAVADEVADKAAGETASEAVAEDVTVEASTSLAEKFSPIGWVLAASQGVSFLHSAGTKLAAFGYKIRQSAAIRKFVPWAAGSSEQKSGEDHTEPHTLGGLTEGEMHRDNKNAEASPYFEEQTDDTHNPQAPQAEVTNYLQDGDMAFNDSTSVLADASKVANDIPGFNWLSDLASLVNKIVGWLTGPINFLISKLFGVTGIDKLLALAIGPLLQLAANWLFPLPNLASPDGETSGTLAAEGASSTASLMGSSIGGKHLTTKESHELVADQNNIEFQQFQQESFFARMTDTSTPYSLISKLALDIPASTYGGMLRSSFASLLRNPVNAIVSSLAGTFRLPSAFAADDTDPDGVDPSGIISTGLPTNDPVFSADPVSYWNGNGCSAQSAQGYPNWNSDTTLDPSTGQTVHNTTNGCLAIQRTAQALGTLPGMSQ